MFAFPEPSSRQPTPQATPQSTPQVSPQSSPKPEGPGSEFLWLPASRAWDTDEVFNLQLDLNRPPRCNLVCIHQFCPSLAGEEEPEQMMQKALRGGS